MIELMIFHVLRDHDFKNTGLFYRFDVHEKSRGEPIQGESWHSMLKDLNGKELEPEEVKKVIQGKSDWVEKAADYIPDMLFDEHNCDMFDNVHPINWVDPKERGKYDIIAIGGGAGGLVTAAVASYMGAKAALIERTYMGGDCLVSGCVPSKAFLKATKVAHTVRTASEYGVNVKGEIEIDFPKIMSRMREIRAEISENDSA